MSAEDTGDGSREFEGPDPHTWRANAELWGLVEDIEVLDGLLALLKGTVGQEDRGPARREAMGFLTEAGYQRREALSRMILGMLGIPVPEDEAPSVFENAGKVRAFGAERPPETGA